jgi:dTDP-4-dehydrorhamnose 3,5-epimerase
MKITITTTSIEDVLVITTPIFRDERGWFFESFNCQDFSNVIGREIQFVQDNHSFSEKGVLRGLHYQVNQTQGKLVRVIRGVVYDVVVDLRQSSQTFGKWFGLVLSSENMKQLWVPEGFAHGFLVLSDVAEVLYKTTDYWSPSTERCLVWDDSHINIDWPKLGFQPKLSLKDSKGDTWDRAYKFI